MEWVKLYTNVPGSRALRRAGDAATVLYFAAFAYCGHDESDGFIPDEQLPAFGLTRMGMRVGALVREGLWTCVDGGYRMSWERQETKDQREQERKNGRERVRRYQQRHNGGSNGSTNGVSNTADKKRTDKPFTTPAALVPPQLTALCSEHGRDAATCPWCRNTRELKSALGVS